MGGWDATTPIPPRTERTRTTTPGSAAQIHRTNGNGSAAARQPGRQSAKGKTMAKAIRPIPTNAYQANAGTVYEQFRYELFNESPRAAYWLEAMVFGLMAQVDDMTEDRALELACKIIAHPASGRQDLQPV